MKTLISVLAVLLTLASVPVAAQTYPNSTTLSASITSTDTVVPLAGATGVAAGGALLIDAEFMPIVGCANAACTRANVRRVTRPVAHSSATVVTVVSAAARAITMLPTAGAFRIGQCSTTTAAASTLAGTSRAQTALAGFQYLPFFDIDTGDQYMCRQNGASGAWVWNRTSPQNINGTAASVPAAWP